MRQVERDGEHMWLRQSVTFSVDGQSRTLEIGIPLRVGATPDEIEALLAEADAGMERIGRHLEARVARFGGTAAPIAAVEGADMTAHAEEAAPHEPAEPRAPTPAVPHEARSTSARTPAAVATPTLTPTPTPAPVPAPVPAPSTAPTAESAPARTIAEHPAPPVSPASVPARSPTTPAAPHAPDSSTNAGAPMALKEFIAAVQAEQGLNPKQAMERLGVKSLAGLNLREALEVLRRQALRDGQAEAPAAEPALAASAPAPSAAAAATASASARYFDEEDDAADIIFTEEDDEDLEAEAAEDDDELDEVPDFGSPPAEPEPPAVEPAVATDARQAPSEAGAGEGQSPAGSSRAARILTHMRGVRGGGVASAQQRSAFKNIVVAELGEPKAKALIAAIWRITPEKVGPEQLDALNNWGKRETFADDVELVLAAVKAEREREREGEGEGAGPAAEPPDGAARATPSRAAPRRAGRASPTGGA